MDLTTRCLLEATYGPGEDGSGATRQYRPWLNPDCPGCALCRPANPHDPPGVDAGGEP